MEHVPDTAFIDSEEELIKRRGHAAVLARKRMGWEALLASLDQFSSDFMAERDQPTRTDCREPL